MPGINAELPGHGFAGQSQRAAGPGCCAAWVFGLAVLAAPVGAEVPDCDTEKDVNGEPEDMLCRMKLYRWTCLVLKGYDVSGSNWTVALADYDDCTIRACNQVLDESGGIPEDIRVECDVPKFDRP